MQNKNIKTEKGFTLIETMVALLILSLVITSIISLLSSGIFAARYAKNEIRATYIAQEGIDYIRNVRDGAFQRNDWATFANDIDDDCGINGCIIVKPFIFQSLTTEPASINPISQGEFRNIIYTECIDVLSTCDQIRVRSQVKWLNGDVEKTRELETYLTMWN